MIMSRAERAAYELFSEVDSCIRRGHAGSNPHVLPAHYVSSLPGARLRGGQMPRYAAEFPEQLVLTVQTEL